MRTLKIYSINTFHVKFTDVFIGSVSDKEPACQCRRHKKPGFNPRLGRFPGEGNGNPLWYSCLENPMDTGAWRATVHGVTKRQTCQRCLSTHSCYIPSIFILKLGVCTFWMSSSSSSSPHLLSPVKKNLTLFL